MFYSLFTVGFGYIFTTTLTSVENQEKENTIIYTF